MGKRVLVAAVVSLVFSPGGAAQAADPLVPGDVIISGGSFAGYPDGLCAGYVCRVDPSTGAATRISGPFPGIGGPFPISDVAIENAVSVLIGSYTGGLYDIGRLDLPSGVVSPVATGIAPASGKWAELTVGHDGRAYLIGASGIVAVVLGTGAVSSLALGNFIGLDVEPGGTLLTTEFTGTYEEFLGAEVHRFVRVDPKTGAVTRLPEEFNGPSIQLEVAASGTRYWFVGNNRFLDGVFFTGPATTADGNHEYKQTFTDMAADPDGRLVHVHYRYPDSANHDQFHRVGPTFGSPHLSYDYDFGIGSVDVMRNPFCSDGADNDGDGDVDYPSDVGCSSATSDKEQPACDDGIDNDGDGGIDWDGAGVGTPDSVCDQPWRNRETAGGCGLGVELVAILALARRSLRRSST